MKRWSLVVAVVISVSLLPTFPSTSQQANVLPNGANYTQTQESFVDWEHKAGAVLSTGCAIRGFANAHGCVLSATGRRRSSESNLVDVAVYSALVFHPDALLTGNQHGGGWPVSKETMLWSIPEGAGHLEPKQGRLDILYNAVDMTISIASNSFLLADGNLFVIRVDESWVPEATQLKTHFDELKGAQIVLDAFKTALPGDSRIHQLRLVKTYGDF